MHIALKSAFVALAMTGAALTVVGAARAAEVGISARTPDVGVSINLDDVAIGYNDGYWDKDHEWHEWQNTSHRDAYKSAKGSEYHDWKHDRDPDKGWHESAARK